MTQAHSRPRVLFLCTGNSCRSQMAEGWLRRLAGDRFEVHSAGIQAHGLNPRAVATMEQAGVDISAQRSQTLEEFLAEPPDVVITVCDHAAASCPTLPAKTEVVRWSFPDPASATGSEKELTEVFARVRDSIRQRIEGWLAGNSSTDRSGRA